MAASPDVIVELVVSPCPPQNTIDDITQVVMAIFPLALVSEAVCANNTKVVPNASVLAIGLWLGRNGSTDAQLLDALRAASFISGNRTAALFVSAQMIQHMAAASWAGKNKHQGRATLNNTIIVDISSADIITKVSGTYDVPVLPDISFTDTITETLTLNPPGSFPALQAHVSTNLDVSQGGIIADSILIALIAPLLGGIALFGGEIAAAAENPQEAGVGTSLANSWPAVVLISKPIVGKVTFTWSALTVDTSGVRTLGTYALGLRSPKVVIAGPTAVSFPRSKGSALESYSVVLTDLRAGNATVVWSGAAHGGGAHTTVTFEIAGQFHIQAKVTDTDNVSATGGTTVFVNITGKGETP
jgi:hypothetical protein